MPYTAKNLINDSDAAKSLANYLYRYKGPNRIALVIASRLIWRNFMADLDDARRSNLKSLLACHLYGAMSVA